MKRWLLAAIAVVIGAAVAGPAPAADLAPEPAYEAPSFNWTGFYVGAHLGGAWSSGDTHLTGDPRNIDCFINGGSPCSLAGFSIPSSLDADDSDFLGGLQAGYNRQSGTFLFGVEGDFSATSIEASSSVTNPLEFLNGTVPLITSRRSEVEWFSTVRGRIGVVSTPRLLLYGTGGVAFGKVEQRLILATGTSPPDISGIIIGSFECSVPSACLNGSSSETLVGWTAGGGLEWALSEKTSLKAEYLFVDLGDASVVARSTGLSPPNVFLKANTDVELHTARVGLNFRFGAP